MGDDVLPSNLAEEPQASGKSEGVQDLPLEVDAQPKPSSKDAPSLLAESDDKGNI